MWYLFKKILYYLNLDYFFPKCVLCNGNTENEGDICNYCLTEKTSPSSSVENTYY